MTDSTSKTSPRWAVSLMLIGTIIAIASGAGLLMRHRAVPPPDLTAIPSSSTPDQVHPTPTLADQALIARLIIQPPTPEVLPTNTAAPTASAVASDPANATRTEGAALTPTVTPTQSDEAQPTFAGTPIAFTNEEKNALSWMCYYEVGGMGGVKYDACLSVISTVRARFTIASGFGTDVMSVLTRPNQFNIPIVTDRPHDTFISTVDQYANGARGSCNAFLYFDSVPGGPSLCIIYGFESYIEFHNGWN